MEFIRWAGLVVLAGLLYRAGGADQWKWCPLNQKWWRWLMGVPLGFLYSVGKSPWLWVALTTVMAGVAYYIATAAFKYGDKSWLNFLGKMGKFIVCGLAFGAASFTMLPWQWAVVQTLISGWAFGIIYILDEAGTLHNPWVEILRGSVGCILV